MRRDHGGAPDVRVDASVNVNPLGPPEALDTVFARARELASRYPEIDAARARQAWADRLDVPPACTLVGNGASELISLAIRAIEPRRVIVLDPCYSEYASAARSAGADVASVPLRCHARSWSTPLAELLSPRGVLRAAPLGLGDLVVVGQPNNPTGHITPVADLLAIAERGAHVLCDESFLALASGHVAAPDTLVAHVSDRISVVASLTKTYCVPGLRLGVLVASEALTETIGGLRDPWSVNGIAAEAAIVLAGEDAYLERSRSLLHAECERLSAALEMLGLRVHAGVAPWVLAELPDTHIAADVCAQLRDLGVAVRDASTFPVLSEHFVRVGVRSPSENDSVLAALAQVLHAPQESGC